MMEMKGKRKGGGNEIKYHFLPLTKQRFWFILMMHALHPSGVLFWGSLL